MEVQLIPAGSEDRPVLENLLQLYLYDFSEMDGRDVDPSGSFGYVPPDCRWKGPAFHVFLIKVDGRLAGFAVVAQRSHFTGDTGISDMAEFFIMRKYRRSGVGAEAAARLFDRFPGRWEVREIPENLAARAFWRKVIGEYTGGRYEERVFQDETWHGPVQFFESVPRPSV